MMPDGVERALADAHLALEQFAPASPWRPTALLIRGVAHALLGATDLARADLAAAVDLGVIEDAFMAQAELAPRRAAGCLGRGRTARTPGPGPRRGNRSRPLRGERHRACGGGTRRPPRRTAGRCPRDTVARPPPAAPARLRRPWYTIQVGLELTRAHLALGEAAAARTVLTETEQVLEHRPHVGSLAQEVRELRERVAATSSPVGAWAMSPTAAELRLLPYSPPTSRSSRSASDCTCPNTRSRARRLDLPQAQRFLTQHGDRARPPGRAPGEHHLPATGESPPQGLRHSSRDAPSLSASTIRQILQLGLVLQWSRSPWAVATTT